MLLWPPQRAIARVRADNWIEKSIIQSAKIIYCVYYTTVCPRKPIGRVHRQRVMSCSAVNRVADSSISSGEEKKWPKRFSQTHCWRNIIFTKTINVIEIKKKTVDENKTKETDVSYKTRCSIFTPYTKIIILYYIKTFLFFARIQYWILEIIITFTTCRLGERTIL